MQEPRAVGVDDGRALVADERLPRFDWREHAPGRLHHPACADDHAQPDLFGAPQCRKCPRTEDVVLPHQRAVEVRGDDLDLPREVRRELQAQEPLVRKATRSASSCLESFCPKVAGMTLAG